MVVIVRSPETKDTRTQVLGEIKWQLQQGLNQHITLVIRVGAFCPLKPLSVAALSPGFDERQATPLHREQWIGDVGACVLITGQTIGAGRHG